MKLLEKILAAGIVLALIMKFALLPGGDLITLIVILLLASIYYPFGFLFFNQIGIRNVFKREAYANTTGLRIAFAFVAGLGFSIICVGSLFKLLNLPGSSVMLLSGLVISFIILIISLLLTLKKDNQGKFVLPRAVVISVAGSVFLFLSTLSIVKLQYRNHPRYIEAYTNYSNDPGNEQLEKKMRIEYYRIVLPAEEFKVYERAANQ